MHRSHAGKERTATNYTKGYWTTVSYYCTNVWWVYVEIKNLLSNWIRKLENIQHRSIYNSNYKITQKCVIAFLIPTDDFYSTIYPKVSSLCSLGLTQRNTCIVSVSVLLMKVDSLKPIQYFIHPVIFLWQMILQLHSMQLLSPAPLNM